MAWTGWATGMIKRNHWKPIGILTASAALFVIPFLPPEESNQGALHAQEQAEEQGPTPDWDCPYFQDYPAHSAGGAAILQRVHPSEEVTPQSAEADARTVAVSKALLPFADGPPAVDPQHSLSFIDFHIFSALARKRIPPANLSSDTEFLRRVTLDLTGRIPAPEEVTAFVADSNPEKRARAIDRLLNSSEWVDRWTMWFGDLLKNNSRSTQVVRATQGRDAFYRYIKASLEQNKPYNQFAAELITATGDSFETGEVNFTVGGLMGMGPVQDTYDKQWVEVATTFLGLKNFDCLLCHDGAGHLETVNLWGSQVTRQQAWGMAAFFSRTRMSRPTRTSYVVEDRATGGYTLNTISGNRPARQPSEGQGRAVVPTYLFSGHRASDSSNYRQTLAQEVTADFQFARAAVNYLWEHFFTVAIVDPPDAFDLARLDPNNPPPAPWALQPSHPELLEELAQFFAARNYDLKALMREICNSRAYQLSSRYAGDWNPSYARLYARRLVRRLDSEELLDALVAASGVPNSMLLRGYENPIPWAMQLPDTVVPGGTVGAFLDTFLRGDRDENPRRGDLSLTQALDLMNDPLVIQRVRSSNASGLLARLLASGGDDTELVRSLYLHVLSRYPSEGELQTALGLLQSGARRTKAEDLLWSLYNKVDFIFNY